MPKQKDLFVDNCSDLPIFSGTPTKAKIQKYTPKAQPIQMAMLCKFCHGAGQIVAPKSKQLVNCPACGEKG